jgi:hypothetical protein
VVRARLERHVDRRAANVDAVRRRVTRVGSLRAFVRRWRRLRRCARARNRPTDSAVRRRAAAPAASASSIASSSRMVPLGCPAGRGTATTTARPPHP